MGIKYLNHMNDLNKVINACKLFNVFASPPGLLECSQSTNVGGRMLAGLMNFAVCLTK